ncbi:hypothetical protein KEM48_002975 [Puccinia striiformis f. sp. tritici PST-130]|nr:hypothetical protein KEM48_002975 [Puccinia striiformis f. sp. tritici PST-130]
MVLDISNILETYDSFKDSLEVQSLPLLEIVAESSQWVAYLQDVKNIAIDGYPYVNSQRDAPVDVILYTITKQLYQRCVQAKSPLLNRTRPTFRLEDISCYPPLLTAPH